MDDARLDAAALPLLQTALLDHYDRTARDLPWRREVDPYRIWVSEVMLQQTRVETVREYYGRWLERFPDLEALADAEEGEVLRAWQGLGYYRRARNLHRGARVVREQHGGYVPRSYSELRGLPGVGDYTAGAVASIAYGESVPAVDGNVRRVLARLFHEAEPKPAWLRGAAAGLVPRKRPGDWNQALMELGATLCTPRRPRCGACPVAEWCAARAAGNPASLPAPPRRRSVPSASFAVAVVADRNGRFLLVKRPEDGLLGGLWAFPEREMGEQQEAGLRRGRAAREAGVAGKVAGGVHLPPEVRGIELDAVRHRFTHLDATYLPVLFDCSDVEMTSEVDGGRDGARGRPGVEDERRRWLAPAQLEHVALPVAQQKIAAAAQAALSKDEMG